MIINRVAVLEHWRNCHINAGREAEFAHIANLVMQYKPLYEPVAAKLGIPFYVIGAIDCREESFNHHGYLGNGDPIWKPTTHVPRGRGPFATWSDGAIDALHFDGMDHLPAGGHWDIVTALIKCEGFNGMGYASKNLPSPYIWGGTSIQQLGKYTSDGHFDRYSMDHQPGCAGIFMALKANHGVDLNEA